MAWKRLCREISWCWHRWIWKHRSCTFVRYARKTTNYHTNVQNCLAAVEGVEHVADHLICVHRRLMKLSICVWLCNGYAGDTKIKFEIRHALIDNSWYTHLAGWIENAQRRTARTKAFPRKLRSGECFQFSETQQHIRWHTMRPLLANYASPRVQNSCQEFWAQSPF